MKLTLLKGRHATAEDAKKGIPYIKTCDVYSPEGPFASEQIAENYETQWMGALLRDKSSFNRWNSRMHSISSTSNYHYFERAQARLVYNNDKPVWLAERWPQSESDSLRSRAKEAKERSLYAYAVCYYGLFDQAVDILWHYEQHQVEERVNRDINIAHNFENAEELIKKRYLFLSDHNKLHLVARLGAMHCPEKYCSKSIEVVNLFRQSHPIMIEMDRVEKTAKSADEARQTILAYAVCYLLGAAGVDLSDTEILSMRASKKEKTIVSLLKRIEKQAKPL